MTPTPTCKAKIPRKRNPTKKDDGVMQPTQDPWAREGYIRRRTNWMWRLKQYVQEKNNEQCSACQMGCRCNRIPLNEKIVVDILQGKGCQDHKGLWGKILGNKQEPYNWNF